MSDRKCWMDDTTGEVFVDRPEEGGYDAEVPDDAHHPILGELDPTGLRPISLAEAGAFLGRNL